MGVAKRCKTCGHWEKEDYWDGGWCNCEKITDDQLYHSADMMVYAYDESGSFWTGPEFGCVHWMGR